jgi:hypothetical protein
VNASILLLATVIYTPGCVRQKKIKTINNKILDGLPCCDGTGDVAHQRVAHPRPCTDGLPAPQFLRNFAAPEGCRFQLSLNRDCWFFSARLAWRNGRKGGRGESPPAQKHGAVCADRLAKKYAARASGDFIGAVTTVPIERESPLRQSAHRKITAVGLSQPQISN